MTATWRERRRAELMAARSYQLLRLVLLYRDAVGLDLYEQLPSNLGFPQMVDAIIDHEAAQIERAEAD
jgi:hypothetical protein